MRSKEFFPGGAVADCSRGGQKDLFQGASCGEILFYQLETKTKTFSMLKH